MTRAQTMVGGAILGCLGLLVTTPDAKAEDVSVTFQNGRVTLVAREATVPHILDRWARIGGTVIVNGDVIPGGPVTLQLLDVPERDALDVVLRSVAGYIAAARVDPGTGTSTIGRIVILPTRSTPQRAAFVPVAASADLVDQADGAVVEPVAPPIPNGTPNPAPPAPAMPMRATGVVVAAPPDEPTAPPARTLQPTATATARPGELPPPPPPVRRSPGPQAQQQQQQ